MICKNYDSLSHVEKIIYVGELLHSCQSDNELYELGKKLIEKAKEKGVLDGVVILPEVVDNVVPNNDDYANRA